jgi:hypothetical protein
VIYISKPAGKLLGWHFQYFISELAESFRDCVNGEKVGSLLAAD